MKKLMISVAAFALTICAKADYLYWMVEESQEDPVEFMYAKVKVEGGDVAEGTYLTMGGQDSILWSGFKYPDSMTGTSTGAAYADLGGYGSDVYSFVVELYGTDNSIVGISQATYSAIRDFVYGDMAQSGIDPWKVKSVQSVPEPTGGMLVLMGTMILAIRRRRVS